MDPQCENILKRNVWQSSFCWAEVQPWADLMPNAFCDPLVFSVYSYKWKGVTYLLSHIKTGFQDFKYFKPVFALVFITRPVFHWARLRLAHPLLTVAPVLVHAFCIPFHTANRYLIVTQWQRREPLCRARSQSECNCLCFLRSTDHSLHKSPQIFKCTPYHRGRSTHKTHIH